MKNLAHGKILPQGSKICGIGKFGEWRYFGFRFAKSQNLLILALFGVKTGACKILLTYK